MKVEKILDVKNLACPMPIIKTKKAISEMETGQVLEVHTTDKGAKGDLTAWTKSTGHELLDYKEENDVLIFQIKKG